MDELVNNITMALDLHTSLIKDLQAKIEELTIRTNSLFQDIEFIRKTY